MTNINKKLLAILLICALLVGSGATIIVINSGVLGTHLMTEAEYEESVETEEKYEELSNRYSKLEIIRSTLISSYYQDVDSDALIDGACKGMVESLGDKYSEYVSSSENTEYTNEILGEFYGIGVTFFMNDDGNVQIESVQMDGPAEKAGLKAGDQIFSIDGTVITGYSSTEAKNLIRGELGTTVEIGYLRNGEKFTTECVRAKINEISVYSTMLEDYPEIGYIRISSFYSNTGEEFKEKLAEIEEAGATCFILDLRENGGGLVDSAVEVADQLMDKGTIAYAVAKDGTKKTYVSEDGRTSLPYVVLVDEYTASASEILSIGIKENKEGILVGTTTFGKGIIQGTMTLPDGSMLKITFMEYFSPSGATIHKVGVEPDYVVELPYDATEDYQLEKAIELLEAK